MPVPEYATATPPQFSLNGTDHVHHGQQPQRPYQPLSYAHPDAAILNHEEPPHLEAATHAGEAPPAYHAAVHYETITLEDYKSLKLSECTALYSTKSDSGITESDAPPTYSEIISGQEENSMEHDQIKTCSTVL